MCLRKKTKNAKEECIQKRKILGVINFDIKPKTSNKLKLTPMEKSCSKNLLAFMHLAYDLP